MDISLLEGNLEFIGTQLKKFNDSSITIDEQDLDKITDKLDNVDSTLKEINESIITLNKTLEFFANHMVNK